MIKSAIGVWVNIFVHEYMADIHLKIGGDKQKMAIITFITIFIHVLMISY